MPVRAAADRNPWSPRQRGAFEFSPTSPLLRKDGSWRSEALARRDEKDRGPVRKLTEEEWREALRSRLLALRDAAVQLRSEIELALAEPVEFPERRHFELPALPLVAGALRGLVGKGRGNRLLFRSCDRFGVPSPLIFGSTSVADPGGREAFAYAEPEVEGDSQKELEACMSGICLRVRNDAIDESWSWSQLITDVANKAGIHIDDERPVSWDEVGAYEMGGVPVIPRLLYRFAQVVAGCGNEVLAALDEPTMDLGELRPALGGMIVFGGVVIDNTTIQEHPRHP